MSINRQLREAAEQTSGGIPSSEAPPTTQAQETSVGKIGHPSPAAKGRGKAQSGKVSKFFFFVVKNVTHAYMYVIINFFVQTALAPPPVVQAPPPTESAVEPELVGDHDGMGLAVGIVSHCTFTCLITL